MRSEFLTTSSRLTEQQKRLRDQLQDLGLIDIIEEATGREVPSLEDLDHRIYKDSRSYKGPAKYYPKRPMATSEGDRRAWETTALGLKFHPKKKHELVVEEQYLASGTRPASLGLRFELPYLNAGTPMATSVVELFYNGDALSIDGDSRCYFDRVPNSSSTLTQDIDTALGKALTSPRIRRNRHYSR